MSAPPADLRFLKRALAVTSESTSEVVSFLEQLYNSVAETMPDVRDDTADDERDPYCAALKRTDLKPEAPVRKKQKYRTVERDLERAVQREERLLPPGNMKECYEQFLLQTDVKVSFKTFWKACLPEGIPRSNIVR